MEGRDNVCRNNPTDRFAQRHLFAARNRRDALLDQPLGVGDRQKRAVESEAIVTELRHYASLRRGAPGKVSVFPICSRIIASACRTLAIVAMSSSITIGTCACGSGASVATATMQSSSGCRSGLPIAAR